MIYSFIQIIYYYFLALAGPSYLISIVNCFVYLIHIHNCVLLFVYEPVCMSVFKYFGLENVTYEHFAPDGAQVKRTSSVSIETQAMIQPRTRFARDFCAFKDLV